MALSDDHQAAYLHEPSQLHIWKKLYQKMLNDDQGFLLWNIDVLLLVTSRDRVNLTLKSDSCHCHFI